MAKDFLSRYEFAAQMGVSLSSVDRGMKKNIFPFCEYLKIGNRVLFSRKLIEMLHSLALNKGADTQKGGVNDSKVNRSSI